MVFMGQVSMINCYPCSYMACSKTVCKQMFLAQLVFEYSIFHDTDVSKTPDFLEISFPEPIAMPSTKTDARLESDDGGRALFLEHARFMNLYVNDSSRLEDEKKEALSNITAQIARLKRCRDSNDMSWSKRQRR